MSIKSQKSLNDECSEIFERSYSMRSVSEESLSCDEDEEYLAIELMKKMIPSVLSKLRRCFRKNKERSRDQDINRRVEEVMRAAAAEEGIEFAATAPEPQDSLWLEETAFVNAINNIFGHHKYATHAQKLFHLLDPFNKGKVWWRQLVCRLVAVGARKTRSRVEVWTPIKEPAVHRMVHCKRENVVKLVNIEQTESFCYVAVTRGGRIGVYDGDSNLLNSYEVFYHRTGVRRRVKNCWITDALYLPDVQYLMLSASDRSLTIYDASTLTHTILYCITGLANIPTCLAYSASSRMGDTSELAIGTERGDVIRMFFHQPRLQFLYTKTADNINYYFWMELSSPPHTSHVAITTWRRVHSRTVRRLCYIRDGEMLVTCSHDNTVSVRIRHVPGKMEDYVFKVQRGVSCFQAIPPLHLLATGSCDGVVRLWEDTQTTPFTTLSIPTPTHVLDVAVLPAMEIVMAFCNNYMIYIWDIYEECLLQSIKIKFPFLGVFGKKIEFGNYSIFPGPLRKNASESPVEFGSGSRRGSSVLQGSTGGLMLLQSRNDGTSSERRLESDPEYQRFNRSEIMLICCDCVCTISLRDREGDVLPPPGDTLQPRRPSIWDPPIEAIIEPSSTKSSPRPLTVPSPRLLEPETAQHCIHDLDVLLENAGLQGILEKDFVLMQGLKHDLNKKLAEMDHNKQVMIGAVSVGAPYLALNIQEPEPMDEIDHMMEEYKRVMKLFPGYSMAGTSTGSNTPTPRNDRSFRL